MAEPIIDSAATPSAAPPATSRNSFINLSALLTLLLLLLPLVFFDRGTRMEILLGDGDTFVHTLPVWTFVGEQWQNLSFPFWTPHIFSGYPIYAEPQTAAFHPAKVLFLFLSPLAAVNWTVLLAYSLAGLWTFLLARAERLTLEASFLAGFAFAFCGYLVGHQAMTGLLVNAAWFPALFYVLSRLKNRIDYSVVFGGGLVILLIVLGGHPQLMFYALFFSFLYACHLFFFEITRTGRWVFARAVVVMYVLGILLAAGQWLATFQLSTQTFREKLSYEIFANPSVPFPTMVTSLISTRLFHLFSDQASEAMLDLGFPVLVLALLGAVVCRRKCIFWTFLLVLGCVLYMGAETPLYKLMYRVPGYNLFRLPTRNGIAIELAAVMLAAYGLSTVQRRRGVERAETSGVESERRRLLPAEFTSPAAAGISVSSALILIYYFGVHGMDDRIFEKLWFDGHKLGRMLTWDWHTIQGSFFPIAGQMLILLVSLAAIVFLLIRWGHHRAAAWAMIVLAFAHFWSYREWIFTANAQEVREAIRTRVPLPDDARFYRTAHTASGNWINFLVRDNKGWHKDYVAADGPNYSLLTQRPSISGYGPLVRRDYSRLAGDMTTSGTLQNQAFFSSQVLDMLGVKYVIVPPAQLSFPESVLQGMNKRGTHGSVSVYENPEAFGLFWGVEKLEEGTIENFWSRVASSNIDLRTTAMLTGPEKPAGKGPFGLPTRVQTTVLSGNRVEAEIESSAPVFLASSQPAYPGWSARVDGESVPLYEVNGMFAALEVPAGRHHIHLHFTPWIFFGGVLAGALALVLFFLAAWKDLLRLKAPCAPLVFERPAK